MAILYLVEQGSTLRKESRKLVVEKDGKVLAEIPEFKIEKVLIFGNIQLTTPAIKFLLEKRMQEEFLNPDENTQTNWRRHFYWQAQKFIIK